MHNTAAGWTLDAPNDVLAQVPADQLKAVTGHIAEGNQLISQGDLVMQADGSALQPTGSKRVGGPANVIYRGTHGSIRDHWWGWEIRADKEAFTVVSNLVKVGAAGGAVAAAVATLVGAISGPVAAVIAASAAFIAAAWTACSKTNGSVQFYIQTIVSPYVWACNPF